VWLKARLGCIRRGRGRRDCLDRTVPDGDRTVRTRALKAFIEGTSRKCGSKRLRSPKYKFVSPTSLAEKKSWSRRLYSPGNYGLDPRIARTILVSVEDLPEPLLHWRAPSGENLNAESVVANLSVAKKSWSRRLHSPKKKVGVADFTHRKKIGVANITRRKKKLESLTSLARKKVGVANITRRKKSWSRRHHSPNKKVGVANITRRTKKLSRSPPTCRS
jgi:hypothetical protein